MSALQFFDLGLSEYGITWERQEQLMKEIVELKMVNERLPPSERQLTPGYLLFVEPEGGSRVKGVVGASHK